YCLPSRPIYVVGVPCDDVGSVADQSSSPLRASKARNLLSIVAPMKMRFPAVVIAPPAFGVPLLMPLASSSGNAPSVTRHAISPVLAFTATSSPHGASVQLHRFDESQNRMNGPG